MSWQMINSSTKGEVDSYSNDGWAYLPSRLINKSLWQDKGWYGTDLIVYILIITQWQR